MALYVIDVLAAIFAFAGFHLAFRPRLMHPWGARLQQARDDSSQGWRAQAAREDPEGVASVLRMIGVMIMAFSITAAAFANLLAHYASGSAG
jgi:hypothetical protein